MTTFKAGDRVRTLAIWGDAPTGSEGILGDMYGATQWIVNIPGHTWNGYRDMIYDTAELELISDPRDEALDRIATVYREVGYESLHSAIINILQETGRMQ